MLYIEFACISINCYNIYKNSNHYYLKEEIFIIRNLKELIGYDLVADNGDDIGKVKDFYFDSNQLIVRYAIVDTGGWLSGRKVLISPGAFRKPNWKEKEFSVDLSKEEIENSPSIDEEKPVSRQAEVDLAEYYDWPLYWAPMAGAHGYAGVNYTRPISINVEEFKDGNQVNLKDEDKSEDDKEDKACEDENCYLRSFKEVSGYNIKALDGEIGHLENLMVADESWIIHYLLVDTRNWLPGKKVLVAPEWLNRVSYINKEIDVELHKDTIKNAPEYDPGTPINREYEEDLYVHYGKDRYW